MYPLYNPESYTSIQDLTNTTNFSSTQLTSNKQMRKNSIDKKSPIVNQQSAKSVTKFKRTNPSLPQSKPNSIYFNKNNNGNLDIMNQKDQLNFQNQHFNQPIPKLNIVSSLTTSRETAQTYHQNYTNFHPLNQTQIYFTDRNPISLFTDRNSQTLQKYSGKNEDVISLKSFKSGKSSKKGSKPDNQNYTIYWKKKAHQYLQNNFKLSQEIQKLKKKLSKYEDLHSREISSKQNQDFKKEIKTYKTQERSVPLHIVQLQQRKYINEIDKLSISNKIKDTMIQNLQSKIIELNQHIRGEKQKQELLQKMRQQVQQLQIKNRKLTKQLDIQTFQKRKQENIRVLQQARLKRQSSINKVDHQTGEYKFQKHIQKLKHKTLND